MLKGLALTPPAIGRIAIGKVVEKNGKRLPLMATQIPPPMATSNSPT